MLNDGNAALLMDSESSLLTSRTSIKATPAKEPSWLALLRNASDVLFHSHPSANPFAAVGDLLVPAMADWCVLQLVQPSETLIVRHQNPARLLALQEATRAHNWPAGLTSVVSVPVILRNETFGTITLAMSSDGRRFDEREVPFIKELALRIALAVENRRLFSEARQAAEFREDMMAVVSHELKNPLTAIMISAALLSDRARTADEQLNLKTRRLADSIRRSAEKMNGLIGNIVDMAKLGAGRMSLQKQAIRLDTLLEQAFTRFLPTAIQKGVALERDIPIGSPLVRCDPQRIDQALCNLIDNAVKFTPKGGKVALGVVAADRWVEFYIRDTGSGIPAEEMGQILTPPWLNKENVRSGGLGLAVAKGIIEMHGGKLWATSEEGRGSTFSFRIPFLEEESLAG